MTTLQANANAETPSAAASGLSVDGLSSVGLLPEARPLTLRDDERQRCEVWTRVMGYHRPVSSFNIGKKGEFAERKFFQAPCHEAMR